MGKGRKKRSKGEVAEASVATVTSKVAFLAVKKRLLERGGAAEAGRRPLHDEPGGRWQQIPVQTEQSEGLGWGGWT